MKRLIVILVIVLAVLLGGGFGAFKYAQSMVLSSIDDEFIPAMKQEFKNRTGSELAVKYDSAVMDGRELIVKGISVSCKERNLDIKTDQLFARMIGWSWLFSDYNYTVSLKSFKALTPQGRFSAKNASIKEVSQSRDGNVGSFNEAGFQYVVIVPPQRTQKPPEPLTVELFTVARGGWDESKDGKVYLNVETVKGMGGGGDVTLDYLKLWFQVYGEGREVDPHWHTGVDSAELGGLAITAEGKKVLTLDKATAKSTVNQDEAIIDADMGSFRLPLVGEEAGQAREAIGQDAIEGAISYKASYNRTKHLVRITDIAIKVKGLGELNLSADFSGLNHLDFTKENLEQEEIMQALSKTRLDSASLSYKDKSLVPKLFNYYSKTTKIPERQLKAQVLIGLTLLGGAEASDDFKRIHKAISEFVGDPAKGLCLTSRPKEPIKLLSFAGMPLNEILRVLSIETKCK